MAEAVQQADTLYANEDYAKTIDLLSTVVEVRSFARCG